MDGGRSCAYKVITNIIKIYQKEPNFFYQGVKCVQNILIEKKSFTLYLRILFIFVVTLNSIYLIIFKELFLSQCTFSSVQGLVIYY